MAEQDPEEPLAEGPSAGAPFDEDPEDTVSLLRTAPGPGDDEEGDTTVVRTGGRRTHDVIPAADDDTARVDRAAADEDETIVGESAAAAPEPEASTVDDAVDEPEDELRAESAEAASDAADDSHDDAAPDGAHDDTVIVPADTSTTQPAGDSTASASTDATASASESDDTLAVGAPVDSDADTIVVAKDEDATHDVARDDDPTSIAAAVAARIAGQDRTRPADPARTEGDIPTNRVEAGSAAVKPVMVAPQRRKRRALKPAPVPPGYGGRAVLASGAGAVSSYRIREIPRPPASAQPLATRHIDRLTGGLTSVSKRSRRLAMLTMSGFGVAIVVSAVGLALIARTAILGY